MRTFIGLSLARGPSSIVHEHFAFWLTHCVVIIQIMRETLIYLSHLDHEDTEQQVISVPCCSRSSVVAISELIGFPCSAHVLENGIEVCGS